MRALRLHGTRYGICGYPSGFVGYLEGQKGGHP